MNMNESFEVKLFTGSGWDLSFFPTYDKAWGFAEKAISDGLGYRVEIKSPGGDHVRFFKTGMVQV